MGSQLNTVSKFILKCNYTRTFLLTCMGVSIVLGASIESSKFISFNTNDGGCILKLPFNRNFAPAVIDLEARQELKPILDQTSGLWYHRIESERKVKVNCGRGNKLSNHESYHYWLLTCIRGTEFQDDDGEPVHLSEGIECSEPRKPTPILHRNGTCFRNATNFDVEFVTESPSRKYYSVCMDETTSGTLYSSSYIDGEGMASGLGESTGNRPDFRGHEFYPFPIKETYKWDNAFEHLSDLLGSEDLVNEYFPTPQHRFSRGHLFPNGDALKRFEKHATFYYINTVPQWQSLNGGNWAAVEQAVRNLALSLSRTFTVTTGAFGVTTLKDVNDNDAEIWLARDNTGKLRLPVPRIVWKVVQDPVGNSAVAFVQLNNPWEQPKNIDILCNDLCSNLRWIRATDFHVLRRGYTYCCDVNELRKSIPYVPDIKYNALLGSGFIDSGDDIEAESDNSNSSDDSSDASNDASGDSTSSDSDSDDIQKDFPSTNGAFNGNMEQLFHNVARIFTRA